MEVKRKIYSAAAISALVLSSLSTPAFAASTIEISGNGSNSDNNANVTMSSNTLVEQNNEARVTNNINTDANTGDNRASDNTGGDVSIDTGSATGNVDVSTRANVNSADVNDCNCNGDTDVLISGNGTDSDNTVNLNQRRTNEVFQDNSADIDNRVRNNLQTGNNRANDNTGGDVSISTGDTHSDVDVRNRANANLANIGGGNGDGGSVSARISGNGSDSDSDINLTLSDSVLLEQNNRARIRNDIDVDARTGNNRANDNTGGDVSIDTGDARSDVNVDNMANFNSADVDCGCLLEDLSAKISGNGTDSDSDINFRGDRSLRLFQGVGREEQGGNLADFRNDVDVDPRSGNNRANDNTGPVNDDVSVFTGDARSDVSVRNEGNANLFGSDADLRLGDLDLDLEFDLGFLRSLLGMH